MTGPTLDELLAEEAARKPEGTLLVQVPAAPVGKLTDADIRRRQHDVVRRRAREWEEMAILLEAERNRARATAVELEQRLDLVEKYVRLNIELVDTYKTAEGVFRGTLVEILRIINDDGGDES